MRSILGLQRASEPGVDFCPASSVPAGYVFAAVSASAAYAAVPALLAGLIRVLGRLTLVLLILLLLKFLPFLLLLRDQLVVSRLQFLVARGISGVGCVMRRQVFRMYRRAGPGFRPNCLLRSSRFFTIRRSRFLGGLVAGTVCSFGAGRSREPGGHELVDANRTASCLRTVPLNHSLTSRRSRLSKEAQFVETFFASFGVLSRAGAEMRQKSRTWGGPAEC